MRLHISAVGKLRAGPERDLVDDYIERCNRTGRALGLGPVTEHQVEDRKGGGMDGEAKLLTRTIPEGAVNVAMDERGKVLSSPDLARQICEWRDAGQNDVVFLIGGADGLAPSLRSKAQFSISFGKMVWPHMLVRVMLAEQLYRATSIISGSPYHRA